MLKHHDCRDNPHGCRLVCDGLVCQDECEWLMRYPEEISAQGSGPLYVTRKQWDMLQKYNIPIIGTYLILETGEMSPEREQLLDQNYSLTTKSDPFPENEGT